MIIIFSVFTLFYALVMVSLLSKWEISEKAHLGLVPPVTVIIPFRNEANILTKTLFSLKSLPVDEIVLCDDHSEDMSSDIIQDFILKYGLDHWKLIDSIGIGKKAAITTAISMSSHELIFTTDADCVLTEKGIKTLLKKFEEPEIQMVCGPVMVTLGKTFIDRYQIAEWASISLVTNYFFKIGKPLMCSAANMAYRKSAFQKVDGYKNNENISSGDDEYLLKKISSEYGPESISYTNHPDALVTTLPTADLGTYLSQRSRWASKWKAHKDLTHAATAIMFFLLALIQVSSVMLVGYSLEYNLFFLVFLGVKIGIDYSVLGLVVKTYNRKISFIEMIGVSIFHPLSVLVIGVFSIFVKNTWKGRVVLTKA